MKSYDPHRFAWTAAAAFLLRSLPGCGVLLGDPFGIAVENDAGSGKSVANSPVPEVDGSSNDDFGSAPGPIGSAGTTVAGGGGNEPPTGTAGGTVSVQPAGGSNGGAGKAGHGAGAVGGSATGPGGGNGSGGGSGLGGGNGSRGGSIGADGGPAGTGGSHGLGGGPVTLGGNDSACAPGPCSPRCGDGVLVASQGEGCDDGNTTSGDGCSSDCQIEPDFTCSQDAISLAVPIIYRDFRADDDFEPQVVGAYTPKQGLVAPTLDAEGKPVLVGKPADGWIQSAASFANWWRDAAGTNSTYATTLTLWNDGNGGFANRYGANGEPFTAYTDGTICAEDDCTGCTTSLSSTVCIPCDMIWSSATEHCLATHVDYDGTPFFFPLDDVPGMITPHSEYAKATLPPPYGEWADEPSRASHNFDFTSELQLWFLYRAGQTYGIDFYADDDVWIFVGNRLALDLGGIHTVVRGTLRIDAEGGGTVGITPMYDGTSRTPSTTQSTVSLGLEDGKLYRVTVFQAEREVTSASYSLKTTGMQLAPSRCSRP